MGKSGAKAKLNSAQIAKVCEMARAGHTRAQIAKRFGVSAATISRTIQRAEAGGERVPVTRVGRPRKSDRERPAEGRTETLADPATRDIVLSTATLTGLDPHLAGEVIFGVAGTEYLPAIQKLVRESIMDGNLPRMREGIKLELEIKERLIHAIPPKPPDPADDPACAEARDRVRERLEDLARRAG